MPTLLLHLIAVERLSADPRDLPPPMARALVDDLPYARFGAALPSLPLLEGARGVLSFGRPRPVDARVRAFHERAPVAFGLKLAELVSSGALVGSDAGLAVVCGYFTHVCVDRALTPLLDALVPQQRKVGETLDEARARIVWLQALFALRELHGRDMVGQPALREKLQLLKHAGVPWQGVGGGLFELVRLAALETLDLKIDKAALDGWVRNASLAGLVLGSPLGRSRGLPSYSNLSQRELYQGPDVDRPGALGRALDDARAVLRRVDGYLSRGRFTLQSRARFYADFPEGAPSDAAARAPA
jgi:hypothetical protein